MGPPGTINRRHIELQIDQKDSLYSPNNYFNVHYCTSINQFGNRKNDNSLYYNDSRNAHKKRDTEAVVYDEKKDYNRVIESHFSYSSKTQTTK